MADWYLQKGEQRIGPVQLDALRSMAATGQIAPNDLVWTEGMPSWQPAASQQWFSQPQPNVPPPLPGPAFGGYAPANVPQYPPLEPLPNLTMWSVLVLIFCCLPAGIIGLVQSGKAKKQWALGDYAGAQATAKSVKTTLIVCSIIGFVIQVVYIIAVMNGR